MTTAAIPSLNGPFRSTVKQSHRRTATTGPDGKFQCADLIEGTYTLTVAAASRSASTQVTLPPGDQLTLTLQLSASGHLQAQATCRTGDRPTLVQQASVRAPPQ